MKRKGLATRFVDVFFYTIVMLFSLICIIPIYMVFVVSITDEKLLISQGYGFFPQKISMASYSFIFSDPAIITGSYAVTAIVTIAGTALSILIMSLLAYPLSRKDFKYRNSFSLYLFFTMLFNGGIVPWYILCTRYLGLRNNIFALIVPYLVVCWYVFLLRNFFATIPPSIHESAKIDGAGEYRILFRIILPLSLPAIATVSLFVVLNYWNDWWLGLMLIDNNKFVPLQLLLVRLLNNIEFMREHSNVRMLTQDFPSESIRMATCIIAIGPIIFAYPFFQKYIIKGIMVGGVKG